MEETALPRRSSTLAPPPLETAASGTRALQRFDFGRTRPKPQVAEPADELAIIVSTVRMSVPESVKNLPLPEEHIPRTITLPLPPSLPLSLPLSPSLSPPRRLAMLREAAWAAAASASLLGIGSLATIVVYVLLFP